MVRYSKLYSVLLGILSFLLMSSFSSWAWEELLERADTDLKAKNYLKAKENYRQVYLTEKKGSLADRGMFGMAKADYLLKNYSEATLNLKRYLSSAATEQRNEAHLMLGYIYMFDRKYTDAARAFEQVGGDFAEKAMIGRAEIALLSGKTSEAERLLERVGKGQFDGSPRAQYIQALLFARKGRGGDALADIDRLSPQALKDEDLRVEKAEIYTACGKAKEAEVMLKGIVSAPMGISEQVRARRALMRAYEVQGKRDEMLALGLELLPYDTNDEVRRKI
ncbi:MAG TPA: hypothetical protein VK445_06820, partial [Dissulfurispiraceae bacterium]|nr:hypothetical protein [Dissulfurispiraceae bacterium]